MNMGGGRYMISWLVVGKERRKQGKMRKYEVARRKERRNSMGKEIQRKTKYPHKSFGFSTKQLSLSWQAAACYWACSRVSSTTQLGLMASTTKLGLPGFGSAAETM